MLSSPGYLSRVSGSLDQQSRPILGCCYTAFILYSQQARAHQPRSRFSLKRHTPKPCVCFKAASMRALVVICILSGLCGHVIGLRVACIGAGVSGAAPSMTSQLVVATCPTHSPNGAGGWCRPGCSCHAPGLRAQRDGLREVGSRDASAAEHHAGRDCV